jgi:hypothetical protein
MRLLRSIPLLCCVLALPLFAQHPSGGGSSGGILRRFIRRQFLRAISVVFAPVLIFRRRRLQLPLGVFLFFERIFLRRIFLALVLEYPVKFRQLLQPFSFIHVVHPRVLQRAQ